MRKQTVLLASAFTPSAFQVDSLTNSNSLQQLPARLFTRSLFVIRSFLCLFLLFLATVLCAMALAPSALAAEGDSFDSGSFSFKVLSEPIGATSGTAALTGFADENDSSHLISIPATASFGGNAYKVTAIGVGAFFDTPTLYYLDFSTASNLTTIGANAFASCGLLHNKNNPLTFPASLEVISGASNKGAFQDNKNLKAIDFSEATKLDIIGACAFAVCGLDYPNDATSREQLGNPLKFSPSITRINASAFAGNEKLCYIDLCSASSLKKIGDFAFAHCGLTTKLDTSLVIPRNVETIGASAFAHNPYLARLYFFEAINLKSIGANAFANCGLTSKSAFTASDWKLVLPPFIESIGVMAFGGKYSEDNELMINALNTVVFMGDKAPEIAENAFTSTGFHGSTEANYNVKNIYVPSSKIGAYTNLPARLQNGLELPALLPHASSTTTLTATPKTVSVPEGSTQGASFEIGVERPGDTHITWEVEAIRHLNIDTPTVAVEGVLLDRSSGEVVARIRTGIGANPLVPKAILNFPSSILSTLPVGAYDVMAYGYGMVDGFDRFVDVAAGTINITGQVQPAVAGYNVVNVQLGKTNDFTVMALLRNAAFLSASDYMDITCEVIDYSSSSNVVASSTLPKVAANGMLYFTFGNTSIAQITAAGAGSYGLRVSAPATITNLAIPATTVGELNSTKAVPSLSGNLSQTREWANQSDLIVTAKLAGAAFAQGESLPVLGAIYNSDDSVVASATGIATANGDIALSFEGKTLTMLAPGVYTVKASTTGSQSNRGIADALLGTLTINKATPAVGGSTQQTQNWGSPSDVSLSVALSGACFVPSETLDIAAVLDAGGVDVAADEVARMTSDGVGTLKFSASTIESLNVGTYPIYAFSSGSESNEAIARELIGELTIQQCVPSLICNPVSESINTPQDLTLSFDYSASTLEKQVVYFELWADSVGANEPVLSIPVEVLENKDYSVVITSSMFASLATDVYSVSISAKESSSHNTAGLPSRMVGYINYGGVQQFIPQLSANVNQARVYGDFSALDFAVSMSGAFPDEGGGLQEKVLVTCEVQNAATSALAAITTGSLIPDSLGAGSSTFSFGGSDLAQLEPGFYELYLSSTATAHNKAVSAIYAGSLTIEKCAPSFSGFLPERPFTLVGTSDFDIGVTVTNSANKEDVVISFELWKGEVGIGAPALKKTVTGNNSTAYQVSFTQSELGTLEAAVYKVSLRRDESAHDKEISYLEAGTVQLGTVLWYSPTVTANVFENRIFGTNLGLSVDAQLSGACPSENMQLACEIRPIVNSSSSQALYSATETITAGSDGKAVVPFGFLPADLAALGPGSYMLTITAPRTTHNEAIGQTYAGVIIVTSQSPIVAGDNDLSRQYGLETDQSVAATVSGLFEPAIGADAEYLSLSCTLENTQGDVVLSSSTQVALDGAADFSFPAALISQIDPGDYNLYVSSEGSAHNAPIAKTAVGSLTVTKWSPQVSISTPIDAQIYYGDSQDFEASFDLSDAHAEDMTIAVVLRKNGVDMPDEMVPVIGDGSYTATFAGYSLSELEMGSYQIIAYSSGSLGNEAIDDTLLGTLTIGKRQPYILPGKPKTYYIGSDTSEQLGVLLLNAAEDLTNLTGTLIAADNTLLPSSVHLSNGNSADDISLQASTGIQTTAQKEGDGEVSFNFTAKQMAQLAEGVYILEVASEATEHNEAISPTLLSAQTITVTTSSPPPDPDNPDTPSGGGTLPKTADTNSLPAGILVLVAAFVFVLSVAVAKRPACSKGRAQR